MPKEKYEPPNPRRVHTIMSAADVAAGKRSSWYELEISGTVRNLCPQLWAFQHITSLYLNDNSLGRLPPEICHLVNLTYLDLSSNKLRSLPSELGDLHTLRELLLSYNYLRSLPFELGRLFQLQNLALKGNPLSPDLLSIYQEPNGSQKLLSYMLDNLTGITVWMGLHSHSTNSVPADIVDGAEPDDCKSSCSMQTTESAVVLRYWLTCVLKVLSIIRQSGLLACRADGKKMSSMRLRMSR
ncbi:hypothetical protein BaRGS_00006462 [Batillaria attramentaria]|uniref:CCR4-NOT transcription complex subunit 6-like n=1 Tax=Batillaria attramentaria TaxID=370345 RepID=A0ABD0LU27_9CAEN